MVKYMIVSVTYACDKDLNKNHLPSLKLSVSSLGIGHYLSRGGGGGGLVQIRGGSPFFMQKFKGVHKKTCKCISQ